MQRRSPPTRSNQNSHSRSCNGACCDCVGHCCRFILCFNEVSFGTGSSPQLPRLLRPGRRYPGQRLKAAVTSYGRDAQGNATWESSADIGPRSTQYDALGLPSQIVDVLGPGQSGHVWLRVLWKTCLQSTVRHLSRESRRLHQRTTTSVNCWLVCGGASSLCQYGSDCNELQGRCDSPVRG